MENVGKVFSTKEALESYLEHLGWGTWRPRYIVQHHTGAPSLKTWNSWQTRSVPVTDEQWLKNLQSYYEGLGWSAGPHFFFTPKHYCVLTPPTRRGVHAVSFNASSWGVECVGDFDSEIPPLGLLQHYAMGFAVLFESLGLEPAPFQRGVRGLHFHRDDPKTTKTCPGRNISKDSMIQLIEKFMQEGQKETPMESVGQTEVLKTFGVVNATPDLNLRADASAKAPVLGILPHGEKVIVTKSAMNGTTKWLQVDVPSLSLVGWVSARYVDL